MGKTWIACALAHSACRNGHSALYLRLPRLLTELAISRADGRYPKLLASLAKTEVVVIDDFGLWRGSTTAIWVTALIGGLADVGYFLFVDLPGYNLFLPGTLMTIVSAAAIVLSFWVWWSGRQTTPEAPKV